MKTLPTKQCPICKKRVKTYLFAGHLENHKQAKVCIACGAEIEYLADFPGPRCLSCHAKKVENEPLEKPDFIGAINPL